MKIKWPSGPALLTVVLIVLLPALAVMQYRWVGQVSEAERERMQRYVRNAAEQFRNAFENDIGRAMFSLQVGANTVREGGSEQYSERYQNWVAAGEPQIIAGIYLVDAVDTSLRLRRFNANSHSFEPSLWPRSIDRWRPHFERALASFRAGQVPEGLSTALTDQESLIAMPIRQGMGGPRRQGDDNRSDVTAQPTFGFTILELDMPYIRGQVLPALAASYFSFSDTGTGGYRVEVIGTVDPSRALYRSDAAAAPIDLSTADATLPLMRATGFDPPFGFRRNVPRTDDDTPGRWQLLVQHQSGSLEAAVGAVRRRNLAISFGVLLMLGVSVALLTATTRKAERLAQQQMEFVAGVSHELRTPVAVIRSASENLSSGVVSGDRVRRYGQMLEAEARRLSEMVERVLQYAGIESGLGLGARAALAPAEIIETAIESALPLVGPEEVQVHRDIATDLPPVIGDAAALRSAVQNLVANAVKYGGRDRWVGIRAQHVRERRKSEVRITVSDHGAGIPAAELPHIFDPFYRGADAIDRQIHGNGLGLSLVRRIVSAHGGRVTVTTRPGAGSAFTIALPAANAAARTDAVAPSEMQVGVQS